MKLSIGTICRDLLDVPKTIIHLSSDLGYVDESYQQRIRGILLILYELAAALLQVWVWSSLDRWPTRPHNLKSVVW